MRQIGRVEQVQVLDAQAAVARPMRLLQPLVRVQYHVHGVRPQRMSHDLIAA